jgi:Trypsin
MWINSFHYLHANRNDASYRGTSFSVALAHADFYGSTVLVGPVDKDGTSGGLAVYRSVVGDKVVHPLFQVTDRGAHSYDFVLFKIQMVQQDNIRPVSLNADPTATAAGSPATMVGFGYTGWNEAESPRLLKASVTTIGTADCEQRYGRRPGFFDESAVCTLGTTSTSCYGDSGGPLLDAQGSLLGIVSFGTTCTFIRVLSFSALSIKLTPTLSYLCTLSDVHLADRLRSQVPIGKHESCDRHAVDRGDSLQAHWCTSAILSNATNLLSKCQQVRGDRQGKVRLPEQSATSLDLLRKGGEESLLFIGVHLKDKLRSCRHDSVPKILRLHVLVANSVHFGGRVSVTYEESNGLNA